MKKLDKELVAQVIVAVDETVHKTGYPVLSKVLKQLVDRKTIRQFVRENILIECDVVIGANDSTAHKAYYTKNIFPEKIKADNIQEETVGTVENNT